MASSPVWCGVQKTVVRTVWESLRPWQMTQTNHVHRSSLCPQWKNLLVALCPSDLTEYIRAGSVSVSHPWHSSTCWVMKDLYKLCDFSPVKVRILYSPASFHKSEYHQRKPSKVSGNMFLWTFKQLLFFLKRKDLAVLVYKSQVRHVMYRLRGQEAKRKTPSFVRVWVWTRAC